MQDKENKLLKAEIENLRMQISEYNQIVLELTEKLQRYENKYGSVFTRASDWKLQRLYVSWIWPSHNQQYEHLVNRHALWEYDLDLKVLL